MFWIALAHLRHYVGHRWHQNVRTPYSAPAQNLECATAWQFGPSVHNNHPKIAASFVRIAENAVDERWAEDNSERWEDNNLPGMRSNCTGDSFVQRWTIAIFKRSLRSNVVAKKRVEIQLYRWNATRLDEVLKEYGTENGTIAIRQPLQLTKLGKTIELFPMRIARLLARHIASEGTNKK